MGGKQNFLFRQAALLVSALAVIVGFFCIGIYHRFYTEKMAGFAQDVTLKLDHMSVEDRYRSRFGDDGYLLTQYIKFFVDSDTSKPGDPVVLLPPQEYFKTYDFSAIVPEPIVYYYFTGCKCVTPQSKTVYNANYAVFLRRKAPGTPGYPVITKLSSKDDVNEVLELYKTHP